MNLPTWDQLDHAQLDVLDCPLDRSLFVVGPPGSGKTMLAVRRASMLAKAEDGHPVVIVTYNRMLRRLLRLLDGEHVDIRTMHSFVATDFQKRGGDYEFRDDHIPDWPRMIKHIRQNPVDVHPVHLVVDEGQDLDEGFYRHLSFGVTRTLTVFADQAQSIGQQSTSIEQIMDATELDAPWILRRNHRTTVSIARLAEHFHSGDLPVATVERASTGQLPQLVRSQSSDITVGWIANWQKNRGGSVGVIVSSIAMGQKVQEKLHKSLPGVRVKIYRSNLQNEDEINVTTDGVTILTMESVKGQEFDCVFILELSYFIPCRTDAGRRAMYMMCARARDFLFLVYGPGDLTDEMKAALPGPDILRRVGIER